MVVRIFGGQSTVPPLRFSLAEGADIEEVTDDMLEKMIVKAEKLSVLFYEENDEESTQGLSMSYYPNCIWINFFYKSIMQL